MHSAATNHGRLATFVIEAYFTPNAIHLPPHGTVLVNFEEVPYSADRSPIPRWRVIQTELAAISRLPRTYPGNFRIPTATAVGKAFPLPVE